MDMEPRHPQRVSGGGPGVPLAGRYRLEGRIAAGAAGEVWRAEDLVLARPVAVKLLRAEHAQHAQTLARFRAEARHAGSLAHPGIAQVYDYGEAGGGRPPFLVMELVDGPSLAGLLAGGPLEPASAMDLVAQAAAGLHAAHLAGLVHRDIKPGNLLVSIGGQVKITDFGIAHAAGSAPLTRTGMMIGTPGYLAPERVAGDTGGPASDLYSLGIVAYECLAGAPPFSGMPFEVAFAHRDRPLPPLPPAVPAEVARLVSELTAKNPAARPASAGEVTQRAGRLRDAMTAGATIHLGTQPDQSSAALTDAKPATMVDVGLPDPLASDRPFRSHKRRYGRAVAKRRYGRAVAPAVAGAAAVGLLGVLLASVLGWGPPQVTVRPSARSSPAASAAAGQVEIDGDSLIGQPVGAVTRQLRQLGLAVSVRWRPGDQQPPGTVLSVQPSGRVPADSPVVVTGALSPHHKDKGNGKRPGRDKGPGKSKDAGRQN